MFEAREWLKNNKNFCALAGNRFASTKEALEFVEFLYSKGAVAVYVDNIHEEDWRIKEDGGSYCDTLIVKLPKDKNKREELMQIQEQEAESEGEFLELEEMLLESDFPAEEVEAIKKEQKESDTISFWWD